MWSRYGSIQDSVTPRLGSVRNAATTAKSQSTHSGERRQETGPMTSESHHSERLRQLDKVDFCLLKLIIKTRLAFYVSVYLYFIFLIIHFYGVS